MNLFWLHNVPLPLDKDTYDCKENKYTEISFSHEYIAISGREYMDISQKALASCFTLHMDYLCESPHLTMDIKHLSCDAAIYLDISLENSHPNNLDVHIRNLCSFTYYESLIPPPKVLQTQDEILLANLPPNWPLICGEQVDKPFKLTTTIYTVINCDDLFTCGILAQEVYLYELTCTCSKLDTKLTLYYLYNRTLTNYDPDISGYNSRKYTRKPSSLTAPDITYT